MCNFSLTAALCHDTFVLVRAIKSRYRTSSFLINDYRSPFRALYFISIKQSINVPNPNAHATSKSSSEPLGNWWSPLPEIWIGGCSDSRMFYICTKTRFLLLIRCMHIFNPLYYCAGCAVVPQQRRCAFNGEIRSRKLGIVNVQVEGSSPTI